MAFDLSSPRLVLAGTAYGECSSGGRAGMENVCAVVMVRVAEGWSRGPAEVCLAPAQFSCWGDDNRHRIEAAAAADPHGWALAVSIAEAALDGRLPMRTCGANSYYALSMRRPAYWAKAPARRVYADRWHSFWSVSPPHRDAPNLSTETADALNEAELAHVAGMQA